MDRQEFKENIGVQVALKSLVDYGYKLEHTNKKYDKFDIVCTQIDKNIESPLPKRFIGDVKAKTFTTKYKTVSIKSHQYNNYRQLGEDFGSGFHLIIVDELLGGVFVSNLNSIKPVGDIYGNSYSTNTKWSKGFVWYHLDDFIKVGTIDFKDSAKLIHNRHIWPGNEYLYNERTLSVSEIIELDDKSLLETQFDGNFKVLSIDHIAVANKDSNQLKNIFVNILGMHVSEEEFVKNEKVNVTKISANDKVTAIELLEPSENLSSVQKFLDRNGSGLHHIALIVDSIGNAIKHLISNDIKLVYKTPQNGSGNKLITFIHPESTPGLLVELCQQT